jgi:homoserine O-acetyltransferase
MINTRTETFHYGESRNIFEVGDIIDIFTEQPLKLGSGQEIKNFPIAFKTYGKLNEKKDNAILICHALTGDQYLIGKHPVTKRPGWWENYCGKDKIINTDEYFVICPNILGGCMGSYGPKSQRNDGDRGNQEVIGLDFPVITIGDMVKVQKELIKAFGINKLNAVIGGSMGGMCVLEWLSKYPEMIEKCMVIASSAKHSAQNIAFNEIGRQAIMADPNWQKGKYNEVGTYPSKGLAIARMMAHVTYLSESGLQNKFGRNLQDRENITYGFDADFQIESYLRYQGMSFIERFDPNSYLYITRAMDYFDLESEYEGNLAKAFENAQCSVCVVSFSSDWLFTPEDSKYIVQALSSGDCDVSFVNIETDKGHDAFLLPDERFEKTIRGFLSE